ncbi:NACHT, LRR and PYD domains-containing protein 3-like isoform X2 [Sardina pilchardus]|uniref:NACHT, LRR and PYD domains-containing protein 3-like isoform X2 n=1 Tax=Sardina pilchardus TaxID=27697 RepID=UPI002E152461
MSVSQEREEAAGSSKTPRPESAAHSCVSKKHKDLDDPVSPKHLDDGGLQTHRPPSPVPSCVSMKSDHSMLNPPQFSTESTPSDLNLQTHRPPSPVPSCVSMKSDDSMLKPPQFSTESTPSDLKYQQIHKSLLQKKFKCLIEGIPQQGDTRLLHEIYTDLYITEGGRGEVNDEHEVRQIERASWRETAQDRPIKCSDIFKRLLEEERCRKEGFLEEERCRKDEAKKKDTVFEPRQYKPLRTVLTKGVAGIGKTVSVQKFILDWAEGTANQDVHFIFPLPFRELNMMKEKKLSLVGLIQHFFPEIKDPRVFSSSAHTVMFIFDGLDECRLPLDFHSNPKCCDVTEPASVDLLLTNLIKGNLLPSALLWITTRPAAANQIPAESVDQVTEVRGFNDPQKDEYFRKRISDENLASRTITHLKSSRSLYIMCHIPVFCWITATVVEETSESEKVNMPRTLTQMYTHFLMMQTSIKHVKFTERKETDEEVIFKLGELAFQQLEKGNLIFYEEDLRECGIDVTEASVYSGVCTQIFREEAGLYQGKVFSFVHLSIQEFLAALYVFLCFSNIQRNMPDQQQTSQLSALFRATTCHGLHKTAVDLALQSKNGHLDLFLRFLLGLSLESNQNLLKHLLPQSSSQSDSSEQTVQYVKQKIRDQRSSDTYRDEDEDEGEDSDRRINLFYCLNELNHHAVVEHKINSEELHVETLLPGQWKTKTWKTFKMSEEQLAEFDLQKYIKTPEEDQTELLSPEEVLQKVLPGVTSALLDNCDLSDKSCSYLASALKTSHSSNLRVLNLSENKLLDSGVELLCSALCHHNCKLEELWLYDCDLSDKSCSYLASALKTSHSSNLRVLHLSYNKLLDSGVELLCSALCHHNCKLETLRLQGCDLSDKSCSYLASALKTSHSSNLRVLDLSNNKLLDSGVELLCSVLCHHNCKLEELELNSCDLSDKSCSYLASALKTSHSSNLRVLHLSHNKLLDSGVELLCSALCHHNCKLEELRLDKCDLSDKSCSYLASALKTSHSSNLRVLDLSDNKLLDSGVELLCSALCHHNCKLEELQLQVCNLSDKSCSYLASALKTSHSSNLRVLHLSDNKLLDSGVELLCSALCHHNCKLETLWLWSCGLSNKSCSYLASALKSPSSNLTQLDLWGNDQISASAVEPLCALVEDPHCKLEYLELSGRTIRKERPAAAAAAAAAASTSSSHSSDAAELHLRDKAQQHPGAQLLSLDTHKEGHHCESCAEVPDSSLWVLVKPEVSTEESVSTYSLSSPAGSYECSESGLRWTCAGPVTLQYRFMDWHVLADDLPHMQYRPAGPSMDIKLMSGELEEIHLPHFLCLGGSPSSLKDAVEVLHKQDSGVLIEKCELRRFHARLVKPSFSPIGLFYSLISRLFTWKEEERDMLVEVHADVQVYVSSTSPLSVPCSACSTFRLYLSPLSSELSKLIEMQEEGFNGKKLAKPRPGRPLQMHEYFALKADCETLGEPTPEELDLRESSDIAPNFFEVHINEAVNFKIELLSSKDKRKVWQAYILSSECFWNKPQQGSDGPYNAEEFLTKHRADLIQRVKNVIQLADRMRSNKLINGEDYENIRVAPTDQEKMRQVFDVLESCGAEGRKTFFKILHELRPALVTELATSSP